MSIPTFRYHPDPLASVFEQCDGPCPCCGQSRTVGYIGPFYAEEEVEGICPDCIADGTAAARWNGEFVDPAGPEPLDDPQKRDVLLHRTPGYFSAQGDPWPVHCEDYCAFVGKVTWGDIEPHERELAHDLGVLEESLGLARAELAEELMSEDSPLWAHLFRCLTCGTHRLVADYE